MCPCTSQKSTVGYVFCLGPHLTSHKTKFQPTVVTSSAEEEFAAAASKSKTAKCMRIVSSEIGLGQVGQAKTMEDRMAATFMANNQRPTDKTKRIVIQCLALQEWVRKKQVVLKHTPGIINPSENITKDLSWVLHGRHVNRLMGYFRPKEHESNRDCSIGGG